MKIVIDIDENVFTRLFDNGVDTSPEDREVIDRTVRNGIPLPKGHGRLIDADAYINKTAECGWLDDIPIDEFNRITPTIIEADKGE